MDPLKVPDASLVGNFKYKRYHRYPWATGIHDPLASMAILNNVTKPVGYIRTKTRCNRDPLKNPHAGV